MSVLTSNVPTPVIVCPCHSSYYKTLQAENGSILRPVLESSMEKKNDIRRKIEKKKESPNVSVLISVLSNIFHFPV